MHDPLSTFDFPRIAFVKLKFVFTFLWIVLWLATVARIFFFCSQIMSLFLKQALNLSEFNVFLKRYLFIWKQAPISSYIQNERHSWLDGWTYFCQTACNVQYLYSNLIYICLHKLRRNLRWIKPLKNNNNTKKLSFGHFTLFQINLRLRSLIRSPPWHFSVSALLQTHKPDQRKMSNISSYLGKKCRF